MRIGWLHGRELLSLGAGILMVVGRCHADTNSPTLEDFSPPPNPALESTNDPPRLELETPRRRAPLGESTDLSVELKGNFKKLGDLYADPEGNIKGIYGHYELWVNGEKYPEKDPRFLNTYGHFNWIPS